MQDAKQGAASAAVLNGQGLHIGVVQARFNADVTDTLWQSCRAELLRLGALGKMLVSMGAVVVAAWFAASLGGHSLSLVSGLA